MRRTHKAAVRALNTDAALAPEFDPHLPGVNYGVLDELLGYAVRRAQIALYNSFAATVSGDDITPQRFAALVIIEGNPGLKLTMLARVLGIVRSGAVKLVDLLCERGYVVRQADPGDKRVCSLNLTPLGQTRLDELKRKVQRQDQQAGSCLRADELKALLRSLDKLAKYELTTGGAAGERGDAKAKTRANPKTNPKTNSRLEANASK